MAHFMRCKTVLFKAISKISIVSIWLSFLALPVHADDIQVAVAANFTAPMQDIAKAFEKETGHTVQLVFGSTGKLYAQIKNGAPFDILLAADDKAPIKLENEKEAVSGSHFTYATGKLVLWSATANLVDDKGEILKTAAFKHIAIADPQTAPYGVAAQQSLQAMDLLDVVKSKLVLGENITQTYQFVATGNAELGFVALSQVITPNAAGDIKIQSGSAWVVTPSLYSPLHQDAVLLNRANDKPAAKALLEYLKGKTAHAIIQSYGYAVD